jgi:hypothetical protein
MSRRPATTVVGLAVAAAATSVAVPAGAVPARCPLVVDPGDDATTSRGPIPVPADVPELDLRSIDVAGSATSITVVIRSTDLAAHSPEAATGGRWEVQVSARESREVLALWASRAVDGSMTYQAGYGAPYAPYRVTLASIPGVVDLLRDEIRMTAPLEVFAPVGRLSKGSLIHVRGLTRRHLLPTGFGTDLDDTESRSQRFGDRSCIR